MKSAKEMFEELGYKHTSNYDRYETEVDGKIKCLDSDEIIYFKDFGWYRQEIVFNLLGQSYYATIYMDKSETGLELELPEIKAIHKQLSELGWLEE